MAAKTPVHKLWREKLKASSSKESKAMHLDPLSSPAYIENLVWMGYAGSEKNSLFVTQLQEGLQMKVLSPVTVTEYLTKLSLGKKLSCFSSAIDIFEICCDLMRNRDGNVKPATICMSISQGTYWVLENTIEVYKMLYSGLKDESATQQEPKRCFDVIKKAQQLSNKLICSKGYEDLNYIGKILFGEEGYSALQLQVRDVLSFQVEKISSHSLYPSFENHLKDFMKIISRFLSSAPKFSLVDRSRGQAPSQSLHVFLQSQILIYLSSSSAKIAEILHNWVQLESIAADQLFMDIFRFISYNILVRKSSNDITFFIAFMFIKLPVVMQYLDRKYKHQNSEKSIFGLSYPQFLQLPFDDLDAALGCDSFKVFTSQCQSINVLDVKQWEHLVKLKQISQVEFPQVHPDSVLNKLMLASKRSEDILKKLSLTIDENREKLSQELHSLLSSSDLVMILMCFAASDSMPVLITALLRINAHSERSLDVNKDIHAEVRAELFNNSFLLLTFIDTTFGDKVFIDISNEFDHIFYTTWRKRCMDITTRKMYEQNILDNMMETIVTSHIPPVNNAQWDQYCWSIGMIVKELTQAHLRHYIKTDALQKVCENLKNKRPALCICALVWLCVQYKTMPAIERSRTVKIINLFKRPLSVASKAAIMTPILSLYSAHLLNDLQAPSSKNKQVLEEHPKSGSVVFSNLISELMPSLHIVKFNKIITAKIFEFHNEIGVPMFCELLLKLILECGKEEEAKAYSDIITCLILMDPIKILCSMFTKLLKYLFHFTKTPKMFLDPHGLYLARSISKAFSTALILFESVACEKPRPTKMAKMSGSSSNSDMDTLINYFTVFLEEAIVALRTNEISAVTKFIVILIEQISMSSALLKRPVKIKSDVAESILHLIPGSVSRDTVTFLCDTTTLEGQETAAKLLLQKNNIS